jgi:hypothetical protein
MKKVFFFLLLISIFFTRNSNAALIPAAAPSAITKATYLPEFSRLSIKNIQQLVGRKLTLKEKLSVKILQWRMRNSKKKYDDPYSAGRTAFGFGLASIILLFIPYITILALPCAIIAIIVGSNAKHKHPDDRKAKTGIILGIISLALILIAVLLVIAILSAWAL